MNKSRLLAFALLAIAACIGLVSCSDDDDNIGLNDTSRITGIWGIASSLDQATYSATIAFEADGSGRYSTESGTQAKTFIYVFDNETRAIAITSNKSTRLLTLDLISQNSIIASYTENNVRKVIYLIRIK